MQKEILEQNPSSNVKVYAVWFNMIWSDSRSFWPSHVLTDPRATNLWDRKRIVGRRYAPETQGAGPDDVMWDTYYLYGPDARWEDAPPPPVSWGNPIVETREDLRRHFLSLKQ